MLSKEAYMNRAVRHFTFFVLVSAFTLLGRGAFAASSQGVITYLEGQVTIDKVLAAIGDPVPEGSTIKTDKESQCLIVFRNRNIFHLAENTVFVFDPANRQTGSQLRQGSVGFVLKNLIASAGTPRFIIRTPTAVAGVRGTSFFIKVEDANNTYVCLCNGALNLQDSFGLNVQDIEAAHHKELRFTQSGGAVTVSDAALLYHTDEDMQGLAGKIGVTIDWSKIDR
jgi:hypothetical protein